MQYIYISLSQSGHLQNNTTTIASSSYNLSCIVMQTVELAPLFSHFSAPPSCPLDILQTQSKLACNL